MRRQFGGELVVVLGRPAVGGAQLSEDRRKASVGSSFLDGAELGVGGAGDRDEPFGMAAEHLVGASGVGEPAGGERPDGLQQVEPRRRSAAVDAHERSSRQRADDVRHAGLFEHAFDVAGGDRTGEHGELGESARLVVVEARLGPGEHFSQAAVAGGCSAAWRPQDTDVLVEIGGQLVGGGGVELGGGHLDGERETVEALHDADHHGVVWRSTDSRRSFAEQPRCGRLRAVAGERCDGPHVFAVDGHSFAARDEDARRGPPGEDALHCGGDVLDDVLGVVEHDQHVEGADLGQELDRGSSVGGQAERGHEHVGNGGGILDRGELDDACAELESIVLLGERPRGRDGSCRRRPGQ